MIYKDELLTTVVAQDEDADNDAPAEETPEEGTEETPAEETPAEEGGEAVSMMDDGEEEGGEEASPDAEEVA